MISYAPKRDKEVQWHDRWPVLDYSAMPTAATISLSILDGKYETWADCRQARSTGLASMQLTAVELTTTTQSKARKEANPVPKFMAGPHWWQPG